MTYATKTIQGITYTAQFNVRNGKYVGTTYTHETEKGVRAVAYNATSKPAMLASAFRKEIEAFKAAL